MVEHEWLPNAEPTGNDFVRKLQDAVAIDLDYWERSDNLPRSLFLAVLPHIPRTARVAWRKRESSRGQHGHHDEEMIWKFEFDTTLPFGRHGTFFIKGYFYTRTRLFGVSIQSFRDVTAGPIPLHRGQR